MAFNIFNMDHKQQPCRRIQPDHGIACFTVASGIINKDEERVRKDRRRFLKADTVFFKIPGCFLLIPGKHKIAIFILSVHAGILHEMYLLCK